MCCLCQHQPGILWVHAWFCEDCVWKYELMSAAETAAWFFAEEKI